MMPTPLYRADAYARETTARIIGHTPEGGVITAPELFYPQGGGQPGDTGWLIWEGREIAVLNTLKSAEGGSALHLEAESPPVGAEVTLRLDWDRRWGHMRIHTALHLLSVVLPLPVTGGQIGADKGRLDFDMPEVPDDLAAREAALNALIARDLDVSTRWISDEELLANPQLVKTMSVQPPIGQGRVRLVRIGRADEQIDLQPCGGTHVARTGEIGAIRFGKIEKKGKINRRVTLHLAG